MPNAAIAYVGRHHVALLALFLALGGTTYAAASLPKNSVGTRQIKNGAVTKPKIAKKTIAALRGVRGRQGLQGPKGDKGDSGQQGPRGPVSVTWKRSSLLSIGPGVTEGVVLGCPTGFYAIGGGVNVFAVKVNILASYPDKSPGSAAPNWWQMKLVNNDTVSRQFYMYVICTYPNSVTSF